MSASQDGRDSELLELALEALADVIRRRQELEHLEAIRLQRARNAGATWQQIADRVGYRGRQGAHYRFKSLLERETSKEGTD